MADIGHKFLSRVFELFQARKIMKKQNRAVPAAVPVENGGTVYMQPAFIQAREFQFVFQRRLFGGATSSAQFPNLAVFRRGRSSNMAAMPTVSIGGSLVACSCVASPSQSGM